MKTITVEKPETPQPRHKAVCYFEIKIIYSFFKFNCSVTKNTVRYSYTRGKFGLTFQNLGITQTSHSWYFFLYFSTYCN